MIHPIRAQHALAACLVGAVVSILPAPAVADTATVQQAVRETGKPARLEAVSRQTTATVEKVDYKKRKLTLKSSDGTLLTLDVGPDIQRLDEVVPGDLLQVEYIEAIAIAVQQSGEPSEPDGAYSVLVRNPTQSPSGKLVETETASATVESVDTEKRVVELLRADGSRVKVPVSQDVRRLNEIKKGDIIKVKLTRSMALSVHKPTAGSPAPK